MTAVRDLTEGESCFCGDQQRGHHHYTVLCYKDDTCLGRLSSDGYTTRRRIRAVMLNKTRATKIADEINTEGVFTAKVKRF